MYLNRKIRFFNMIEVLLAMTVIAIGMTSVLGLFPVGLNASRQAVAENCSADIADQMIAYLRVMGESSTGAYNNTFDFDNTRSTDIPTYASGTDNLDIQVSGDTITIDLNSNVDFTDTTDLDVQTLGDDFLAEYKSGAFSNYPRVAQGWAIFAPKLQTTPPAPDTRRRVYFITQGPNCTEDGGNRNIDYSAMALVWKSTVQIQRLESDGTTWSSWPTTPSYTDLGQLNIELSWPLTLPYAERKKRYYQVVINTP